MGVVAQQIERHAPSLSIRCPTLHLRGVPAALFRGPLPLLWECMWGCDRCGWVLWWWWWWGAGGGGGGGRNRVFLGSTQQFATIAMVSLAVIRIVYFSELDSLLLALAFVAAFELSFALYPRSESASNCVVSFSTDFSVLDFRSFRVAFALWD